jgi:predicted GNAT family acetyltransferase
MTGSNGGEILHDTAQGRFSTTVDGYTGYVEYVVRDGVMDIAHTIVPGEIGGRGIAGRLVEAALEYARDTDLGVRPTCEYAAAWMNRHPEYAALRVD